MGRVREEKRREERRSNKRKSQKKEDPGARKGRKVAKHYVFPMICGSGRSGAEPCGQMRSEKLHAVVARNTFRSENVQSTTCSRRFWRFRCRFAWQAQRIVHLVKSEQNVRVLQHFQKRHLKRICKDAFSVAGAVQKTCSWEMLGGQGAHFLRGVAFWSIRSVGLLR